MVYGKLPAGEPHMADLGTSSGALTVLELRPEPTRRVPWLREIWSFRGVVGILARKDFQVRYKRASFGIVWAVLIPVIQATVFVIVFSRLGHFNNLTFSYPAYVLSGTLAWSYFNTVVTSGSTSIVDGASITDKVWFPRSVLVLVPVISNLFSLATSMLLLIAAMPIVHAHFGWRVLLLIPACALLIAFTTAFSLVTSALHVYFRDVKYMVIALLLVLFYLTPIVYPASALHRIGPWLALNPLTGIIGLFQLAAAGPFGPMRYALLVSVAFTVILFVAGLEGNRRRDRLFVDKL
jgi:lipopolysaccharide transport system permease protein